MAGTELANPSADEVLNARYEALEVLKRGFPALQPTPYTLNYYPEVKKGLEHVTIRGAEYEYELTALEDGPILRLTFSEDWRYDWPYLRWFLRQAELNVSMCDKAILRLEVHEKSGIGSQWHWHVMKDTSHIIDRAHLLAACRLDGDFRSHCIQNTIMGYLSSERWDKVLTLAS